MKSRSNRQLSHGVTIGKIRKISNSYLADEILMHSVRSSHRSCIYIQRVWSKTRDRRKTPKAILADEILMHSVRSSHRSCIYIQRVCEKTGARHKISKAKREPAGRSLQALTSLSGNFKFSITQRK